MYRPGLNRRRLLAGGAVAVVAGAAGVALWPGATATPPGGLRALSASDYAVVVALAEAVLDVGSEPRPSAQEVDVAVLVDRFVDSLHPATASETRTALQLLENGLAGLVLDRRFGPFSLQTVAERRRIVRHWQRSRATVARTAIKALVGLVLASYWSDPRTFAFVGYPS